MRRVAGIGDYATVRPGFRLFATITRETAMRTKSVVLQTHLGLREVAGLVNAAFAAMNARVEAIESSANPLDNLDGVANIAVVGGRASLGNGWAVQVYLFELGDRRGVELVALGGVGFLRTVQAKHGATLLSASTKRLDTLVAELRARDPRAQLIA